ncbi:hypothetical protein Tco_0527654 [Tanacetum coccineum]
MEEVKYGEFGRPFPNNSRNDGRFNRGASGYDQPSSGERRPSLTEIINKYIEEAAKRHTEQDEWLKKFYQNTETSQESHDKIIRGLEKKVKTLPNDVEGRANDGKFEECKTILLASFIIRRTRIAAIDKSSVNAAKVGHTEVSEPVKKALLKTWLFDCFQEELAKDPWSRSFDDYKWMLDLEVDQLADEYELGIGNKGYMLDDIWENCKKYKGIIPIGGMIKNQKRRKGDNLEST